MCIFLHFSIQSLKLPEAQTSGRGPCPPDRACADSPRSGGHVPLPEGGPAPRGPRWASVAICDGSHRLSKAVEVFSGQGASPFSLDSAKLDRDHRLCAKPSKQLGCSVHLISTGKDDSQAAWPVNTGELPAAPVTPHPVPSTSPRTPC